VAAALVLLVAAPREWLGPALAGLIPLAIFMAYRRWHRYQQSLVGPDNVRIDERGVHWLDAARREQSFVREDVLGFRIAREEDTLRPVAALTLELAGGFESQPLEVHAPATPEELRRILTNEWKIPERSGREPASYDVSLNVYSECHEEWRAWHWEGSQSDLGDLFDAFESAASELLPPPMGAKPLERIVLARRRQSTRLRIAHALATHWEHDLVAAPAEILRQIADQGRAALQRAGNACDISFEIAAAPGTTWTFHLHVRVP
jgi:hypothetical protein